MLHYFQVYSKVIQLYIYIYIYIYIHVSDLFQILFLFRSLYNIEQSFLCSAVGLVGYDLLKG